MRLIVPAVLLLVAPLSAFGSARIIVVTKANQQQQGVEFDLTTEKHPDPTLDTVFVKLVFAKKGKLERLDEVHLQIKEGDVLALRAPLSLKEQNGTWSGTFHVTPAQARKCVLRLVCPSLVPTSVTTYDVRLETYLGQ